MIGYSVPRRERWGWDPSGLCSNRLGLYPGNRKEGGVSDGKAGNQSIEERPMSQWGVGASIVFFSEQRIHQNCLLDRVLGTTLLLSAGFNPALFGHELPYF